MSETTPRGIQATYFDFARKEMSCMNYQDFCEFKEAMLNKRINGIRLKPAQEGFNAGLLCAVSVFENMVGNNYDSIKQSLLKKYFQGQCTTNREDGFNDAILRAVSKLKEISEKDITAQKDSIEQQIQSASIRAAEIQSQTQVKIKEVEPKF